MSGAPILVIDCNPKSSAPAKTMATKNVEDTLDELELNGNHEPKDNYIYIKTPNKGMDATINVEATEQWEKELMADPKVETSFFVGFSALRLTHFAESSCALRSFRY